VAALLVVAYAEGTLTLPALPFFGACSRGGSYSKWRGLLGVAVGNGRVGVSVARSHGLLLWRARTYLLSCPRPAGSW
jgi:hypothetical protein